MPRGQTAHLQGKRTGRPRGTGRRSRLLWDMRWAYETLDDPNAHPPSAGAKRCKEWAERDLPSFLALLGKLEAAEGGQGPALHGQQERSGPEASENDTSEHATGSADDRRLMTMSLSIQGIFSRMRGEQRRSVVNIPGDARIVSGRLNTSKRAIELIVHSITLPVVEEGKPLPSFAPLYCG